MKEEIIIGIHQPNFFPWPGYFNKIFQSDVFVFLDDVQIQKTGGSWFNRVQIMGHNKTSPIWITAPINRKHGFLNINEAQTINNVWKSKLLKTIHSIYGKHPYFKDLEKVFTKTLVEESLYLKDFNLKGIQILIDELHLKKTKFLFSSALNTNQTSNERLVEIIKYSKGSTYICGMGSSGYLNEDVFEKSNIAIKYQSFRQGHYFQKGSKTFVPGLSILDTIANIGLEKTREYIKDS